MASLFLCQTSSHHFCTICVVKDEFTPPPFDTGVLNYHQYDSSLESWALEDQINKLSEHITVSNERCKGKNNLWKYFGSKAETIPVPISDNTQEKAEKITNIANEMIPKTSDGQIVTTIFKGQTAKLYFTGHISRTERLKIASILKNDYGLDVSFRNTE